MSVGYLFAILTGFLFGLQGTYGKSVSGAFPATLLAWANFTFAIPFILLLLLFSPFPTVDWFNFGWATLTSFVVNIVAWILFFRALSLSPLYLTMPFTALTPLFTIPVAFVLLHEAPGMKGAVGIALIIAGAYGIHARGKSIWQPFLNLYREKGTRYMLIVALIWSVSATVEKVAVRNSSPQFYALVIHLLLAGAYFPYVFRKQRQYFARMARYGYRLAILGAITGIMAICQFSALKYLDVSYVIAFKRAGVIVSVLLGYLIFKEKGIVRNLLATLMIVLGAILLMW